MWEVLFVFVCLLRCGDVASLGSLWCGWLDLAWCWMVRVRCVWRGVACASACGVANGASCDAGVEVVIASPSTAKTPQ